MHYNTGHHFHFICNQTLPTTTRGEERSLHPPHLSTPLQVKFPFFHPKYLFIYKNIPAVAFIPPSFVNHSCTAAGQFHCLSSPCVISSPTTCNSKLAPSFVVATQVLLHEGMLTITYISSSKHLSLKCVGKIVNSNSKGWNRAASEREHSSSPFHT
jgi:hypothetical protein